jgi:hypothetical protein
MKVALLRRDAFQNLVTDCSSASSSSSFTPFNLHELGTSCSTDPHAAQRLFWGMNLLQLQLKDEAMMSSQKQPRPQDRNSQAMSGMLSRLSRAL